MSESTSRNCKACRELEHHPMFMMIPAPYKRSNTNYTDDDKVLLAARLKCTCFSDMHVEYGANAADLSHLKPEIRKILYDTLKNNEKYIPLIDSEIIDSCQCIAFITGISKKHFKSWMALDLLTYNQLEDFIKREIVTIEQINI